MGGSFNPRQFYIRETPAHDGTVPLHFEFDPNPVRHRLGVEVRFVVVTTRSRCAHAPLPKESQR